MLCKVTVFVCLFVCFFLFKLSLNIFFYVMLCNCIGDAYFIEDKAPLPKMGNHCFVNPSQSDV